MTPTSTNVGYVVRPSTLDDAPAVNELLQESYGKLLVQDYAPEFLETALPHITTCREELLTCGTWYVCQGKLHPDDDADSILGCGGWTPHSPMAGSDESNADLQIPNLRHFATHPQATRRGIARAIWNKSLADMNDEQRKTMEVISTTTAIPFYKSLGFEAVKDMELPLNPSCLFPCTLMRREEK